MKTILVLLVLALGACRVETDGDGDADAEVDGDVETDADADADSGLATFHCIHESEDPYFDPQVIGSGRIDVSANPDQDPDLSDGYQHQVGYAAVGHCPGDEAIVTVTQDGETIWETLTQVSTANGISLPWVTLAVRNGMATIRVESARATHSVSYEVVGF